MPNAVESEAVLEKTLVIPTRVLSEEQWRQKPIRVGGRGDRETLPWESFLMTGSRNGMVTRGTASPQKG